MAKPRGTNRQGTEPVDPASAETSDEAIAIIRKYYDYGKKALSAFPEGAKQDSRTIQQIAAEAGVSLDLIRKARVFAKLYDEPALEALLRLRTTEGRPLTWSHVRHLVTVKDTARRTELARLTAKEGWKIRELKDEAEAGRGGPQSQGGRPRRRPRTPAANLLRLAELCEGLRRFWEDVQGQAMGAWVAGPTATGVVAEVRVLALRAAAKLDEVEAMASQAAKQLRAAAGTEDKQAGEPKAEQANPDASQPARG